MPKEELVRLVESGDLSALVLAVNRAWVQTYYPEARYAELVAHVADGAPDVRLPLIPSAPCGLPREPSVRPA